MSRQRCLACMKEISGNENECPNCGSAVPCKSNSPESLQPGYELGHFLIGKETGRDLYSIRYIAYDRHLQKIRQIREFFPKGCGRRPDMKPEIPSGKTTEFKRLAGRFVTEARITAKLTGSRVENIINVYDILNDNGKSAEYNHLPYVVMEYLEGCSMEEWMRRQKGPMPWREAVKSMCSVLQSLGDIHELGALHRDICLENIFRLKNGEVRLTGFAYVSDQTKAKEHSEQLIPNNRQYYAPQEQKANSAQDVRTDVYAAGVCLFRMVAGGWPAELSQELPFPAVGNLNTRIPVHVPPELDSVINKATQPDPRKRYSTAKHMLSALQQLLQTPATQMASTLITKQNIGEIEQTAQIPGTTLHMSGADAVSETENPQPEKKDRYKPIVIAMLSLVLLLIGFLIGWVLREVTMPVKSATAPLPEVTPTMVITTSEPTPVMTEVPTEKESEPTLSVNEKGTETGVEGAADGPSKEIRSDGPTSIIITPTPRPTRRPTDTPVPDETTETPTEETTEVINPDDTDSDGQPDQSDTTIFPSGDETEGIPVEDDTTSVPGWENAPVTLPARPDWTEGP